MAAAALARIARSCGWTGLVEEGHPDHFAGPWLEAGHHHGADLVIVPYHAAGQQRWHSAAAVQCHFFAPHPAGPGAGEDQHWRRSSQLIRITSSHPSRHQVRPGPATEVDRRCGRSDQ